MTLTALDYDDFTDWEVFVDTNVLMELYSNCDVWKVKDICELEERAKRYAGTCWLAMSFVSKATRTLSFGGELQSILRREHPPADFSASKWVRYLLHVLHSGNFFEGWRMLAPEGTEMNLNGEPRDRLIGEICRRQNKPIISRDNVQKPKAWKDLKTYTPEEWSSQFGITKTKACKLCRYRIERAVKRYLGKNALRDDALRPRDLERLSKEFMDRWNYLAQDADASGK